MNLCIFTLNNHSKTKRKRRRRRRRSMRFPEFVLLLLPLLLIGVESQALEGCKRSCGGVNISYPFGIEDVNRCAKNASFLVECRNDKPYLILNDKEIVSVDLDQGEITLINNISTRCIEGRKNENSVIYSDILNGMNFSGTPFSFSTRNKLIATGCATSVFLFNATGGRTETGCSSMCRRDFSNVLNGTCSGFGCCQSSINNGLKIFNISFATYYSEMKVEDANPCSFAFLVEVNEFYFDTSILRNTGSYSLQAKTVLDFAVDVCGNNTFNKTSSTGVGYNCSCLPGYKGINPYTPNGCTDINECMNKTICSQVCINTPGSYRCTERSKTFIAIISGLSGGLFILLFGGSSFWFYKQSKKAQMKKLRKNNFNKNRRLLELTLISASHGGITENTKLFTLKELEKATNKFDEARIIGEGGHGTVYKGLLLDQRVAAIKMSKVTTQREKEEYINEVALLSRTYHNNVVKLLGCCLESEVPLLVYEFIFNGTLSDHLHDQDHSSYLPWDDRLRIASEVASAIVYLLSASSNTIFHRDLKSANILLDEKLTAKLSDFGASRSISSDQTHVMATVQGTIGYLDPEYYQTGKLTEKSDVYSFGVILVELLTGKKPISNDLSLKEESIIIHFIKLLSENKVDQIFDKSIVEEAVNDELDIVAKLAGDFLNWRGEDRPTMKEIESKLESIRRSKKKHLKRKENKKEQVMKLRSFGKEMVGDSQVWSSDGTYNSSLSSNY